MDVIEAIKGRISVRAFKPDPVPREVLQEILDISTRSPSALNSQPWEVAVIAGEVLEAIKRDNVAAIAQGTMPDTDVPLPPLEGVYRQRQVDLAIQLFGLMGIAREDKEKRAEWTQRGFRFFDAPAALIISADSSVGMARTQFDIGCFTQTICLVAMSYGLGTCIAAQGVMYPDVVRRHTGIPRSKLLTISIAIGYPDWDFPANKLVSAREPVEAFTTWYGLD